MIAQTKLIAQGPLVELHRRGGATLEAVDGWLIPVRYPQEPGPGGNALLDFSHWPTYEINGRETGAEIQRLAGADVPVRKVHLQGSQYVYRLSAERAIIFGGPPAHENAASPGAADVTGGWASLSLVGPDAERILNKVTAVDLRERTLPIGSCCQAPIFGVNTLFGRFSGRFDLHVCSDSAQFFWEVLMDAGLEFRLRPGGIDHMAALV